MHDNNPIVIGFEQIQAAAAELGLHDLADLREVTIRPDKVIVTRYVRDDEGHVRLDGEQIVTESSTIPVIADEQAEAALAGGR